MRFDIGDACALAFPDHSFDRVLSLLVLHFVPRQNQPSRKCGGVARPGAVVGAAVWDARGGFVANRLFFDTAAVLDPRRTSAGPRNYTRPMTRPGELANAWRTAGFTDVVDTALSIRMEYASFETTGALGGQDGPSAVYVATLSEIERTRLRDAVRLAYVDGEPTARARMQLAWAVKGIASASSALDSIPLKRPPSG